MFAPLPAAAVTSSRRGELDTWEYLDEAVAAADASGEPQWIIPMRLARREHEVLELICGGHTNVEIAARLFISVRTVDHHVSAVLAKLGTPTREAAAHAAQLKLAGTAET